MMVVVNVIEGIVAVTVTVVIVVLTCAIVSRPKTAARTIHRQITTPTYQALLSHWNQQNTLLWSRIQTLLALQVPVLAFELLNVQDHSLRAFALGLLGALLTLVLGCIIDSDRLARDSNLDILDHYAEQEYLPIRLKGPARPTLASRKPGEIVRHLWSGQVHAWIIGELGRQRTLIGVFAALSLLDIWIVPLVRVLRGT